MYEALLLIGAGFLSGAMNALAGGGSFVSIPALVAAGVPSVTANASSTVALLPGGVTSAWVYRGKLGEWTDIPLIPSLILTVVGGIIGAVLLLVTSNAAFDQILPWLLLTATIVLGFGPRLGEILRRHIRINKAATYAVQFALGIYGGYFGGAVGLMMMASWSLLSSADVKTMAPARVTLVTAANTIAAVCFVIVGAVWWMQTLWLGAGALAGGYGGAFLGKLLPARLVRAGTLIVAAGMTAAFFAKAYWE